MPGLRTFALAVVARGGARWEDETRSGWSHLLEHLVFKGAGDMDARQIVERVEATGGQINAATGYERTSFEVRGVEGSLPMAMQVISDLVFRPRLTPAEIEREKDVVGQEIAEAFDTPDDHVFEMAQTRAFAGQPLGRPILGSVASIGTADAATVADWRAMLYAPERMVVSVSGAVDENELLALCEQWFGEPASSREAEVQGARFTGGHAMLARRIEQANLVFQLPGLAMDDDDAPALRLFTEILGGGMASRLFQSAREERGLAYAIDAYGESYEDAGLVGIYAGASADRAVELAEVAAGEFRDLAENGPRADELDRARAILSAGLLMADESPASRAGRHAAQAMVFGRPRTAEEQVEAIGAVVAQDLIDVGQRILKPARAATAVLGPRAASGAGKAFSARLFG